MNSIIIEEEEKMIQEDNDITYRILTDAANNTCGPIRIFTKYYTCGYSRSIWYNHAFSLAIGYIGYYYYSEIEHFKNSNYHNGIALVAKKADVSKSEIKSMGKKYRCINGYIFKLPYSAPRILKEMIALLKKIEGKPLYGGIIEPHKGELYRSYLYGTQIIATKQAYAVSRRRAIHDVLIQLESILETIGSEK